MSITDIVGTDNHVGEIIPSTDDDNSVKVAEDQPQEEGSDEKQQNQNWITTNKPTLLSQGTATDETHSLEPSEDYALHYLTRSVVKMMDNIGFSTCHESVLNILTDLCKRYMQRLWIDSKVFAEHAGRRYPIFEDANMAFGKLMFSAAELHAFMRQVQHDPLENSVPLFPIRKSSINLLSIYGPVSDKELAERPEHIPRYFPAMHPEWCSDQGVRAADILMKSVAQIQAKNNKCIPRARVTKPKISFPDFSGSTAKELGFVRPQKLPARKVAEEPSGISSSANKTTGAATNSATRTKLRKWPMHEPASSSKHCDRHHVKENLNEKDTPSKPFSQRSIGMFGMPPSALVHPESVATEKMKRKKKRDRDRDKDRTKERKERHRDKDKNEENPGTSSAIPVAAESHTNEKAIMNASCSTDAKSDGQAKKSANRQQDVLSSEHQQIERDMINLENNVTTEKSLIEEENVDKLKHDHSVDLRLNDDHSTNDAGLQMTQILVPQHSSNSASDVEDGIRNGSNAIEKAKEGMKDGAQQNDKKDPSRSTVVEIAKGNLKKRKTGEKGCERKKVARKAAVENSLSVVIDDIAKNSTTLSQDIKALKVVLSRPTGQKIFTALSPSSGTERAVKEVEQKCDSGSVQGAASITPSSVDEPQIAESICEKKKHRKEKDRDKHHSKEHKRKDKEKYKEHKKSRTKDKEKKYIKPRPEKFCLKRSGEHILRDEMPAPKIPKLKIRFGSNSSGVNASPSVSTTSTILTSSLSSDQLSERSIPSSVDQNIQVMQSANKLEDREMTNPLHTSLKSDVNIKPRKRQPVTKAELKALPKLPLKARTCGTKEGSGLTGGQGPAERALSPVISKADIEFEQRNVQQPMGKRLRMDNGKKDFLGSCFDPHDAVAFNPTEKVFKAAEKERNSESHVQGMMSKDWGQLAPRDIFSTFLTDERRPVKESLKRNFERFKKKPGQVNVEAESDSIKPKLGKKRIHLSVGVLLFDREKLFIRDRSSGKLKCKELEKEKRKERHHSMEKVKENGREKGSHHVQKAPEKEKDQTKRDEKGLEIVNEKKGMQQNRQKEKGNDERKKRGSGESEKGKGKGKKIGMVGMRSGDIYLNSCGAENDKKHRENVENVGGSEERRKRKSVDKDEEYRKGAEKVAKKYSKETRCSSETKERAKHHDRKTAVEEKVKSRDKDFRDKEKRKKHSSDWGGEHSIGKTSKEVEKAPFGKDEDSGDLSNLKTNSGKDELTGNDTNSSYLPYDAVQKTDRVIPAKEQLSKRSSADSDVFGSRSSTTDSLTKSSDKKSATLDSDDSLDTMWICPECSVAYVEGATDMVGCDACDNWFHWNCVGLLVAPPDDVPWYCQNCAKKKLKKKGGLKSSTSKKGKK
ncbi:Bromodomain associated family protein [Acanthocheilonema viteae]